MLVRNVAPSLIVATGNEANLAADEVIDYLHKELENSIGEAIRIAVQNNELRDDVPVSDFSLIFVAIINSSDPTTRDTQSFARVAELFKSYTRIIERC